jgi:hypothetical protein
MGNRKHAVLAIGVALLCAMAVLCTVEIGDAQECRIVRVYGHAAQAEPGLRLEPQTIMVNKDTCVIWVNLSKAAEVKVIFEDGKKCADATDAPSAFTMVETCYVTSWVPHGATSSLTFKEPGTYNYEVEWKEGKTKENGRIVVQ